MADLPTVLVIGGAGFIGSHTTLALKAAGYRTIVYDNFSAGHRAASFGDVTVEGDLGDGARLAEVFASHGVDAVLHFAALIEAGVSVHQPLPFFRNNVAATITLLGAMAEAGVRRIVFSSTAAAYGNAVSAGGLLPETLPMAPITPYGQSKCMVETILAQEARAAGLQAIALRYFNAAGADPDGRTGERHDPETHLIPLVIQAALGQRAEIKIFGTDYDTPDGTCIRDYIHVSDLAQGHVAALADLMAATEAGFDCINLGTGQGHSVRQVVEAVKAASGRSFPVIEAPRRPGDPARLIADPARAHARLGWRATRSDLETIVADAWRFFHAAA